MALYTEQSADFLNNILANGAEERKRRQLQQYEKKKAEVDSRYSTNGGGIGGFLSNLTRDIGSAANTIGTTLAAVASPFVQNFTNTKREAALDDSKKNMDAIAQKYGYASKDEAFEKGDGPEEMWNEFKNASSNTQKRVESISNNFKNNAAVQKINNTKQSQYGADALRTLNNMAQVMLPGYAATPVGGMISGSVEGIADSIENADGTLLDLEARMSGGNIKNTENTKLDAGDLAKRMAIGGVSGLATAGVGNKLGNAKSAIGSKILNNRLITSGVGRGAVGGAVGGVVGSGLGAAMEGGDVVGSAIQGGGMGAVTGGLAGGLTSGSKKLGSQVIDQLGMTDTMNNIKQKYTYNQPKEVIAPEIQEVVDGTTSQTQNLPATTDKTIATSKNKASLAGQLTKKSAERLLDQYGTISKPMAKSANAVENVQKVADAGFEKPAEVEDIISKITGSSGEVTKLTKKLVSSATPVDTFDGIDSLIDDAIAQRGLVDKDEASVRKTIEAKLKSLPSRREGSVDYTDNPEEVFKVIKNLESRSANLKGKSGMNYSTTTPDKLDQAAVLDTIANELKERIYANAAPMETILTQDVAADLKSKAPKNQKWANYVDNTIMKAKNIGELRNSVAPFVNMGKIIDDQYINYGTYGQRVGDFGRDAGRIVSTTSKAPLLGKAVEKLANSNVAKRAMARGYRAAANLANAKEGQIVAKNQQPKTITTAQPIGAETQMIYNLLGRRIGEVEGTEAGNNAIKAREYKNLEDQLSNNVAQIDNDYMMQMQNQPRQMSQAEAQLADISNGMNLALAAGDIDSYNQLASLYKTAYSMYEMQNPQSTTSELSTAEKNQLAKLQSAGTALDQLEELYNKAGGGQGVLGGNIANFLGSLGMNPDVNTYNQLAQGLINQIGAAIGKTDSLNTEGEVQRALSLVPKITDDNQTAMNKLATLRQLLQQNTNSYNQIYGA